MDSLRMHRVVGVFGSFLLILFAGAFIAQGAGIDLSLEGYLWGADDGQGVGFISFCGGKETATCLGNVEYHVIIDNDTGVFRGYGWSPNFGWLSFNKSETGVPPEAPFNDATTPYIARVDPIGSGVKQMEGWGRFLSACDFIDSDGDGVADRCASTGPGVNSGGWDGWVNFSSGVAQDGTSYDGFIATSTGGVGFLRGFAWGSDTVGWIEANEVDPNFLQAPEVTLPSLWVELSAQPTSGKVPLGVTLTAVVHTSSSLPITYSFACDELGRNPGTFTTTTVSQTVSHQCTYTAVNTYKPVVEIEQAGVFAKAVASSYITNAGAAAVIDVKPGIIIEISPDEY